MNIFYIKEFKCYDEILNAREKNFPKFIKKIWAGLKIKFGKFNLEDNILILPINKNKKVSNKKLQKIMKRIVKSNAVKCVVLSKELNLNDEFKCLLNSFNIDILDGRFLFRFVVFYVIDFVLEKRNKKIQDIELSLLLNELDDINMRTIFEFAKKVKRLNIVTNHMELFKKVEQKLYDEGIMIMISNNKRKSLLKSDIVLNLDFVEENLKEYKLNCNCTIINISSDIKIYSKGFNGININNYDITFENVIIDDFASEFDNKLLYESKIYGIGDFDRIFDSLASDNVAISEVIGNKGDVICF